MDWAQVDKGGNIDLLCRMTVFDVEHDAHVMELIHNNGRFILSGLVEAGYESYTVFDATLDVQYPVPKVSLGPTSCILGHRDISWDSLFSVMDMCSGFGGMSQGLLPCGFHATVAVDQNERMLHLYSKAASVPTVLGDVGDKKILQEVWKLGGGARTMTGGFSCQPFSALGDKRSSLDPRSSCLSKLLYAAFYMRTQILVLECVAPAAQDHFVKSELEFFCALMGFSCEQRTLNLDQVWPCKRNRSWWVLTSPMVGKVAIPDFQCLHVIPSIDRIIPFISPWDKNDEAALSLSDEELFAFGGHAHDFSQHLMNMKGKSPCALHAWGNQLTACPCGCRPVGLSTKRLEEKGLFGLLVHSAPDNEGQTFIRHVHPCEALALNGMDPTLDFGTQPRLILSAVGQLACPIQVMWVMSAIASHLEELKLGKSCFTPEIQLNAYMSWLVSRCNMVWPSPDTQCVDKFALLLECWNPLEHLSLEELVYPNRWEHKLEAPVTIAAILDLMFREFQQRTAVPPAVAGASDDGFEDASMDPETPWLDTPIASDDPDAIPGLNAAFCTIVFDGDVHAPVLLSPTTGTTLNDLLTAQSKLVGSISQCKCTDVNGQVLPHTHVLDVGQIVFVGTAFGRPEAESMEVEEIEHVPDTHLDPSPTAAWTQPAQEHPLQKPSVYDVGECSVERLCDQPEWLSADPLLGIKGDNFLQLSAPQIANTHQLWSIRHQFLKVADRLTILDNQGTLFADDEIRYHLFVLGQKFIDLQVRSSNDKVKQLVTIDPVITTAWVQNKGFSCEEWGKDHGFVHSKSLPVAAVFHVAGHWIPAFMRPIGDTLNVCVWDADSNDHLQLNNILEKIGLSMGFLSVIIQRERRMFFSSDLCGPLAIAYLHDALLHIQLPVNQEETLERFHLYRDHFVRSIASCDITKRPWIWGKGDRQPTLIDEISGDPTNFPLPTMLTRDQRLALLSEHGTAVADDEIRFHIQHIIQRYHTIMTQRGQSIVPDYLSFEPLVFTCWESIGRTISARWSERHPEVRAEGVQVLTAFHLDNHWFPVWWVPKDQCITFHTVAHETVDAHKLRDVCACIGQQLGFPLFALHVFPSGLPSHEFCGTHAMMFLAHVVHGARLPDSVSELSTLHTNMRATFVADLYTKTEVPAPVLWGNGSPQGESGLLPKLPSRCPFAALSFDAVHESPIVPDGATGSAGSLVTNTIDWQFVKHLFQWQANVLADSQVPQAIHHGQVDAQPPQTNALDAAEIVFHVSRIQALAKAANPGFVCPAIQVLPDLINFVPFLSDFLLGPLSTMIQVVLINQHWIPIVCVESASVCRIFAPAGSIIAVSRTVVDLPSCHVVGVHEPLQHNLCGAFVIDILSNILCNVPVATSVEELECRHLQFRTDYIVSGNSVWSSGLRGFGPQGALQKELAAELTKHGVPVDQADTRANEAIKALGSDQIATALRHRQPWRQLKTLGNNSRFKFVLPSEIAQFLETDASATKGGKGRGKQKPMLGQPMDLDPGKLQLLEGFFRVQGRVIPQIHPKQIGPVSSGVILMSHAEAEPYLRVGKAVSTEPLAMLVLHRADVEIRTTLPHLSMTVPCRCAVDNEPLLVDATLVQIGQGLVEKHTGSDLVELDTLDVVTLKYLVYRDELPCSWEDFSKAPIKYLVNTFPLLRRCLSEGCKCDMWHNDTGLAIKEPIVDVWRRQYLRTGFKPSPVAKADMFSVCLRVPSLLVLGLLATSGSAGAYCEPRTADGTEVLSEFTVIWTPKMTVQELLHLKQTNPGIIGLARVGDRKGLRVLSNQASACPARHCLLAARTKVPVFGRSVSIWN